MIFLIMLLLLVKGYYLESLGDEFLFVELVLVCQ